MRVLPLVVIACVLGAIAARRLVLASGRRRARGYSSSLLTVTALAAGLGVWASLAVPDRALVAVVPVLAAWAVLVDVDCRTKLLPDLLTLGAAGWLFAASAWTARGRVAIVAGVATAAVFLILALLAPSSYGLGDVKLGLTTGGVAGWFGGWPAVLAATLAFVALSLVGVIVAAARRRRLRDVELPFGPFLVLGALVAPWLRPEHLGIGSVLERSVEMSWTTGGAMAVTLLAALLIAWAVSRPTMAGTLTMHGVGVERQFLLTGRRVEIDADGFKGTVTATRDPDRVRVSGVGVGGSRRSLMLRDGWTRRVAGHPMTFTSRGVRIGHQLSFDTTLQEMGLAEG